MAKVKKKPTKTDIDRMIMGALCNFVNAEIREYKVYMMMGSDRNDLMYLATHAKKAGVDMATALDVSIPFLLMVQGFPFFHMLSSSCYILSFW